IGDLLLGGGLRGAGEELDAQAFDLTPRPPLRPFDSAQGRFRRGGRAVLTPQPPLLARGGGVCSCGNLKVAQEGGEGLEVLLCQDLGGGHEGALEAVGDGDREGGAGDGGLAGAYVALEESGHGAGALDVARDLGEDTLLGAGEGEWQRPA